MTKFFLAVLILPALAVVLLLSLAGCVSVPKPDPIPNPVVVDEKKVVNIDQELLKPCDDPATMPGAMGEAGTLDFMMGEASKLKVCKERNGSLISNLCRALNCTPPAK